MTLKPSPTVGPWSLGVTLTIPSVLRVGGGALIAMKRLQGAGGRGCRWREMGPLGPGGGEEVCCLSRGPWPGLRTGVQPGGPEPRIGGPSAARSAPRRA